MPVETHKRPAAGDPRVPSNEVRSPSRPEIHPVRDRDSEAGVIGVIECDLHVPDHLKPHFGEMSPFFKNTDISREDIGDFMKAFAEEHNIMRKPRQSLIGKKILLITLLLNCYLAHGLQVTKIHPVVEYTPKGCIRRRSF